MSLIPNSGPLVLCIGDDRDLLQIRAMVLQHAGYAVCQFSGTGVLKAEYLPAFAFVVLCHSISLQKAEAIASLLRFRNPSARVIRLSHVYAAPDAMFDSTCDTVLGPRTMLSELDRLAGRAVAHC